jgi:hypothetical protein
MRGVQIVGNTKTKSHWLAGYIRVPGVAQAKKIQIATQTGCNGGPATYRSKDNCWLGVKNEPAQQMTTVSHGGNNQIRSA